MRLWRWRRRHNPGDFWVYTRVHVKAEYRDKPVEEARDAFLQEIEAAIKDFEQHAVEEFAIWYSTGTIAR